MAAPAALSLEASSNHLFLIVDLGSRFAIGGAVSAFSARNIFSGNLSLATAGSMLPPHKCGGPAAICRRRYRSMPIKNSGNLSLAS